MDLKRWLLAALGAFGAIAITDYVIHHIWLGEFYQLTAHWWRSYQSMSQLGGMMILSQLSLGVLLAVVYHKGYRPGEDTVGQGFRFGVLLGLLLHFPSNLMAFVVYPYPIELIFGWFMAGMCQAVIVGMVIGYLYKPAKRER